MFAPSRPARIAVFDIGNVLLRWDPRFLFDTLIPDDGARDIFLTRHCSPAWNLLQDAGRPWAEAEAEAVAIAPHLSDFIRAYRARWIEMVPGAIPQNVQLLEDVRAAGIPNFAITNFAADTLAEAETHYPFLSGFDGRIVSGTEGIVKPDPEIYRLLLRRYGLAAEDCLFIDDNAQNIETARHLGFHVVHYTPQVDARAAFRAAGLAV